MAGEIVRGKRTFIQRQNRKAFELPDQHKAELKDFSGGISSLRLGRSRLEHWRDRPRCTDILRLKRSRPGRSQFSVAAAIGVCNGTSWDLRQTEARSSAPTPPGDKQPSAR